MDHMQIVNAIQTQELPAFLSALEAKYGKGWIEKNFALMAIVCEEGAGSLFRTMGNGTNANIMKIAHAGIRSLAKMIVTHAPLIPEVDAIKNVMNTLWKHITGDLGREGVPDTIFNAVMESEQEKNNPPPPPSDVPQEETL